MFMLFCKHLNELYRSYSKSLRYFGSSPVYVRVGSTRSLQTYSLVSSLIGLHSQKFAWVCLSNATLVFEVLEITSQAMSLDFASQASESLKSFKCHTDFLVPSCALHEQEYLPGRQATLSLTFRGCPFTYIRLSKCTGWPTWSDDNEPRVLFTLI